MWDEVGLYHISHEEQKSVHGMDSNGEIKKIVGKTARVYVHAR